MGKTMKIAVIGGGPGGYVAAIRAAQLGAEVTLIEKHKLGGTCLNVGCIPTKSLLHSAECLEEAKHAAEYGIKLNVTGVDWSVVQQKKEQVIGNLVGGIAGLMKANKIKVLSGTASFHSANELSILAEDGATQKISFDKAIIASGSSAVLPPIPGLKENPCCVDSSVALSLTEIPKRMLVIGGGVIGVELASVYRSFGSEVTIVELAAEILPFMEQELAVQLRKNLEKRGIDIFTSAAVKAVKKAKQGASVAVEIKGKLQDVGADLVLVATGRKAEISALDLDKAGIKHENGNVLANEQLQTNLPNVYAIGDCLGQVMLAHVASAQGEVAAEHAMGQNAVYRGGVIPSCVYTSPEFAGVGLTEEQAKAQKKDYIVGKFPMAANGKALIENGGEGMIKVILGKQYKEILGIHILGPRATDLIAECALAISMEATAEDVIQTIHAHPTVAEAVREAIMAAEKMAIHIPNK